MTPTRRMILRLIAGLALALPLAGGAIAASSDTSPVLARIADSGKLRVGMSAGQPPYNMKNRDGKIIGMDADLAELLAASLEVELEIVEMPFSELLDSLERGRSRPDHLWHDCHVAAKHACSLRRPLHVVRQVDSRALRDYRGAASQRT